METECLSQLSYDIGKLFDSEENYDTIIQTGTGNNIKEIKVHSIILYARSLYFRTALSKNWVNRERGIIKFKKPNISPKVFNFILKYLYTGKLEFNNYKPIDLILILVAADEMNIEGIIKYLLQYLIDNHQKFLQKDPVNILQNILQHEACSPLKDYCLDYICERPKLLFNSEKYLSLDKSILLILLDRKDLFMDEVEVWNYLIKWGVAQVSTTNNIENLSNWSSDDFDLVKGIITEFIPLIRWLSISSIEFHQHVIPFKNLLPENLIEEIKCYHTNSKPELSLQSLPNLPSRKVPLDSIIINQKHLSIISSWIDHKDNEDIDYVRIPYTFKLLFRATRDGFNNEKFHESCDRKGAIFVVISLPNSSNLIGGYNPLDWKPNFKKRHGNNWWKTSESFLFSLTKNTSKGVISRISRVSSLKSDKAILYNEQFGPGFGGGPDLVLSNNQLYCKRHCTYPGSQSFISDGLTKMEDYEVFQITRKKIEK